jgi:hypothetical protein
VLVLINIQTNDPNPHHMSCSHSHVVFGVDCLCRDLTLKGTLPAKVHQTLCEKIMKPGTNQNTK